MIRLRFWFCRYVYSLSSNPKLCMALEHLQVTAESSTFLFSSQKFSISLNSSLMDNSTSVILSVLTF